MLRTPFTATVVASAAALSVLLLLPAAEGVADEMKAACEMWSKLENKTLPLQNEGHANCTTNDECTGFNCKGIYQVGTQFINFFSVLILWECCQNSGLQNNLSSHIFIKGCFPHANYVLVFASLCLEGSNW